MSSSRYLTTTLFFLVLFAVLAGSMSFFVQQVPLTISSRKQAGKGERSAVAPPVPAYYDRAGEQINYSLNMGKVVLGTAVFKCLPNIQENGRVLANMIFETRMRGFQDKETIYSDAVTLMPVRVIREIQNMFKHENIVEHYDHRNFTLTVIKKNGQKEGGPVVFKKDSPIHNAVLLPHYVRTMPDLVIGQVFTANLAKRSYEIKLVSMDDVMVPAGAFKTYHFESMPRQIEIWLTDDKNRIPVKILGLGIFPYSLEMTEYIPPQKTQNTPQ